MDTRAVLGVIISMKFSGEDDQEAGDDTPNNQRSKKYHRHTPRQIQELETDVFIYAEQIKREGGSGREKGIKEFILSLKFSPLDKIII
ncbi:hypothetical protein K1719_011931 [Acacia pycnantha]|nr:hypothetical protein K1719_011931 [Acacia pycnantha]